MGERAQGFSSYRKRQSSILKVAVALSVGESRAALIRAPNLLCRTQRAGDQSRTSCAILRMTVYYSQQYNAAMKNVARLDLVPVTNDAPRCGFPASGSPKLFERGADY